MPCYAKRYTTNPYGRGYAAACRWAIEGLVTDKHERVLTPRSTSQEFRHGWKAACADIIRRFKK